MSRNSKKMKRKLRKHRWFIGAVAALLVALLAGLIFAPHTDGGSRWSLPQVQPMG